MITNQPNPAARQLPPDQISPKAVVQRVAQLKYVAKRNWLLLLIIVAIGGISGFIYDALHKTRVTYTGSIVFNLGGGSSSNAFGDLGGLASAFGLGGGAPDANIFTGDNFLIYARSRPVVEKTLMAMDTINGKDTMLVNYYIRHSGIRDKEWEEDDTLRAFYFKRLKKPADYTKLERRAMADIYNRVKGEIAIKLVDRKSSFMELSCFMEDEALTVSFLNRLLAVIESDYQQKQTKKTREMSQILENRADSLARIINGNENRLAQYMDQNQQVVVAQAKIRETKMTRNTQFLTTLYYQVLQQADNMRLSVVKETPLFTIIEGVSLPLFRETLSTKGFQIGVGIALFLAILIIFIRETYRSIMKEE